MSKELCPKCHGNVESCAYCDGGWITVDEPGTTTSRHGPVVSWGPIRPINVRPATTTRRTIFVKPQPPPPVPDLQLITLARREIERVKTTKGVMPAYLDKAESAFAAIRSMLAGCRNEARVPLLKKLLSKAIFHLKTAQRLRGQGDQTKVSKANLASQTKAADGRTVIAGSRKELNKPETLIAIRMREAGAHKVAMKPQQNNSEPVRDSPPAAEISHSLTCRVSPRSGSVVAITAVSPGQYFSDWVRARGIEFGKLKPGSEELELLRLAWIASTGTHSLAKPGNSALQNIVAHAGKAAEAGLVDPISAPDMQAIAGAEKRSHSAGRIVGPTPRSAGWKSPVVADSGRLAGKPAGSEERVRTKPRMYFSDWVSAKGIEFAKLKPRSQELAKLREEWMFEMAVDGH